MAYRRQGNSDPKQITAYTDGACPRNGQSGAQGGIGVYFPDRPDMNFSGSVQGRQTNQAAEIQAATRGIQTAKANGYTEVVVKTDSKFVMDATEKWMDNWKDNGWTKANGDPVKNQDDFRKLDEAMQGMDVRFEHVRGHRGNPGNEQADQFAREGARRHY